MVISIPWPHHTGGEGWLVDGVRELLSLQTESSMLPIHSPLFASQAVIRGYEVTSVELNTWLVGETL